MLAPRRQLRIAAGLAIALVLGSCASSRPPGPAVAAAQQRYRPGAQAASTAPPGHFTGRALVERMAPAAGGIHASAGAVTFEPGARSAWHTHPRGQYLIVTAGAGRTQEWGKPMQELRAGDVIWCPPGVKHWHGAAPATAMTHVAITGATGDGESVTWMEHVSDAQYLAGPPRALAATSPLSAKQQAIPLIAAFAALSDRPRLHQALQEGLDAGLTISESKEILIQLYAYAGFPRSLNALDELMKVLELREQRGVIDAPGREPSRELPEGAALIAAGAANQTRISGAPVRGPVFDFAPIINRFLQAHLFGAIFERDNLDWQSRELATVGALSATPGAESQLRSHMAASLRVGLTAEQLARVTELVAARVDAASGRRAEEALARALPPAAPPADGPRQ